MSRLPMDELSALIGREVVYRAPEPLGRAAIRYFALAVGDDNPLYTDEAYATAHGRPSVVAPPTLVCETNQYMIGPADSDGYIGHTWDVEVAGSHPLRGGHSYRFGREARPEDILTVRWRVVDVTERRGGAGRAMAVVTSEATITAQDGDLLAVNTETLIYVEPPE